jgi:hypothetical protein
VVRVVGIVADFFGIETKNCEGPQIRRVFNHVYYNIWRKKMLTAGIGVAYNYHNL